MEDVRQPLASVQESEARLLVLIHAPNRAQEAMELKGGLEGISIS